MSLPPAPPCAHQPPRGADLPAGDGQARFQAALLELTHDAIVVSQFPGPITDWNRAAEQLYGYSRQEAIGQCSHALLRTVHPAGRRAFEAALARAGEWRGELIHTTRDGQQLLVESRHLLVQQPDGRRFVLESSRDITARRQTEAAQARLAAIVNSSSDAILSGDLEGTIVSWNRAAEALFGYTAAEVIGQSIALLVPAERADELRAILAHVRRGDEVASLQTQRLRKDGTRVEVAVTISPVRDVSGAVIGTSSIARDSTDRKRAEAERERLYRELLDREDRLHGLLTQVLLHEEAARRRTAAPELARLSKREQEVVVLVADGKSNPQIGQALGCSALTARNHVQNVLTKLGLGDRTQLAVWAVRHGLVPLTA